MGKIVDGLKRLVTAWGGDPTGIHTIGEATAAMAKIEEDLNDEGETPADDNSSSEGSGEGGK